MPRQVKSDMQSRTYEVGDRTTRHGRRETPSRGARGGN